MYKNIETDRLLLKSIDHSDCDFIYSMFSDDVVNRYLFDAEPITNLEEAEDIINFFIEPVSSDRHRWIIKRKSDNRKMGTCGFHCYNEKDATMEIGYDLKEEFWDNGYMIEALQEVISFARNELSIKQVTACIYLENIKSIRLVEKIGFRLTGSKYELFRGENYLHNIYSLSLK